MRPAFRGLGRAALECRAVYLMALPTPTTPCVRRARCDRAFELMFAFSELERAEALEKNKKGDQHEKHV